MDTLHFGTAIGCTSRIVIIHIFQHGKGIVSIVFAVVNIAVTFAFVQVFAAFTAKTFAIFPAQDLRRRRKHDAVVDDGIEINNFVVVGKRILVRGILKKSFFHGDFVFHRSGRAAAVAIENRFRGENLKKVALEIYEKKIEFSEDAQKEITVLIEAVIEIVVMTTRVYEKNDLELAARVEPFEQVIDRLCTEIKSNHINRLQSGDTTIEKGFVLSDLLTNCERISDHCSNIAVAVIEAQNDSFDTHSYLNSIKYGNDDFKRVFDEYNEKYDLQK